MADFPDWVPLLFGPLGSLAEEVAQALRYHDRGRFPSRYRRAGFYLLRAAPAAISAALVYGYGVTNPILAFHIGPPRP